MLFIPVINKRLDRIQDQLNLQADSISGRAIVARMSDKSDLDVMAEDLEAAKNKIKPEPTTGLVQADSESRAGHERRHFHGGLDLRLRRSGRRARPLAGQRALGFDRLLDIGHCSWVLQRL